MKGIFSNIVYSDEAGTSAVWVLVSTAMVFLMIGGYSIYESGLLRQKNSQFILIKNLIIACLACIIWWLCGYGLAYGGATEFIGTNGWYFGSAGFEKMSEDNYLRWVYELAYVAITAVLFTGPLAERARIIAYIGYAFILIGFIYPIIVAWIWGGGWLMKNGFHDFAGSGVIHMVAGISGFWGAVFLGERYGKHKQRKNQNKNLNAKSIQMIIKDHDLAAIPAELSKMAQESDDFQPSNQTFMIAGTAILWVCWLFFTGGKTYNMYAVRANAPPKIFMNTFLGGASGGLTAFFFKPLFLKTYKHVSFYDGLSICNGILAGLVSITAGCDRYEPWAAVVIGIIGGILYSLFCKYLQYRRIDDPVEGSAVHMICGMWGLFAVGLLDNQYGLIYNDPSKGHYFGWQVCGIVAIFGWVSVLSISYYLIMNQFEILRVNKAIEVIGYDLSELGGLTEDDYNKIILEMKFRLEVEERKEKEDEEALLQANLKYANVIKAQIRKEVEKKLNEKRGEKAKLEIEDAQLDDDEYYEKHVTFCTCCCRGLRKKLAIMDKGKKDNAKDK